ncbi:glycosyltransferase family 10 domain-containing protein [Hymenobacter arizonensis]|uniref:Glycosyltransferase family 10 (Fucosyltransferase) C-term n=1 Tax=Hymenobacter arizonensis TaxID=1227077 RepID=A0A1I5YR22_HYMAR|nr:glycosyltransferase family 10 [Hymenobacter arizonensis]SFQ46708.1 Glycosyltransferase family 10 (fucosyltransferase) C-term [Hymenobacter arizonensis]
MKATLVVLNESDFLQNRIFSDLPIKGVKNYGYMFAELRRQLAEHGVELATQDIHPPEESSLVIGLDVVDFFQTYRRSPSQRLYLLLNEPETYYPEVWKKENHAVFDRVFTYDYSLADGNKYIHHYFAIDLDGYPPFQHVTEEEFNQRKLLVLMAGMFQFTRPKSRSGSLLYTRYRSLRWFGKNMPQQFAFYSRGVASDSYGTFRGLGVLQRLLPSVVTERLVDVVGARRRRIVESLNLGPVPPLDKLKVIRSFRFVICYENTRAMGYISEKIFDCIFAGCVPVYLGEPDIQSFVPAECFIDRRKFATDASLADFLTQMPYSEYAKYIHAMHSFTVGLERQKFGSSANANRIVKVILADMSIV